MCARWLKDFKPATLLNRINELASIADNKVVFHTLDVHDLEAVLGHNLNFQIEIPDEERRTLVRRATARAILEGECSPDAVLRHAKKLESEYLRKPITDFLYVTTLSLKRDVVVAPRKLKDCRLRFYSVPPRRLKYGTIAERIEWTFANRPLPKNYTYLVSQVRDRSPSAAARKAFDSLEFQRAIWNFLINRTRGVTIREGRPEAVNEILPGPFSTIHNMDWTPCPEMFWFEPGYVRPANPYSWKGKVNFEKRERILRRRLLSHAFSRDIEHCVVRYNRAMDSESHSPAFIELWSLLEVLANADHRTIVARVAFLFRDSTNCIARS